MAEDQGRFWLTAVEPELPPLGRGVFLLSKHAKTMGSGYLFGSGLMVVAATVETIGGVAAERKPLEAVARPLSST